MVQLNKDGQLYRKVGTDGISGEWLWDRVSLRFDLHEVRAVEIVEVDHGIDNEHLEDSDLRGKISRQIRAIGQIPENRAIRIIGPDGVLGEERMLQESRKRGLQQQRL